MEGLDQHFRFQIKLAGKEVQGGSQGGSHERVGPSGAVPDDIPDIAMMVPIEKVD